MFYVHVMPVDGHVISSIGRGLCILVGLCKDDTPEDTEYICRKILATRIFDDDKAKPWSASVQTAQLNILCVSQFTLYAKLAKSKPDYHMAMPATSSQAMYASVLDRLRKLYRPEAIFGSSCSRITSPHRRHLSSLLRLPSVIKCFLTSSLHPHDHFICALCLRCAR